MMRALPRVEDLDLAMQAATRPKSRFEQWHGLELVKRIPPHLDAERCLEVARALRSVTLDPGSRYNLRETVLAEFAETSVDHGPG